VVRATGSTNVDLLAAATSGAPDRSVLVADHQTAGRGRLDRTWVAPPGVNLLASILFRRVPAHPHLLTQRVALAAADATAEATGRRPVLKWPNDLLLDGGKLAGILAQAGGRDGRIDHVVVGIGLNVGWAPPDAAHLDAVVPPLDLLAAILRHLDAQPDDVASAYRAALDTIGRRVRVQLRDGDVEGRALDVEADGRLVVLDGCGVTHRVDTGDVVHLRPA